MIFAASIDPTFRTGFCSKTDRDIMVLFCVRRLDILQTNTTTAFPDFNIDSMTMGY